MTTKRLLKQLEDNSIKVLRVNISDDELLDDDIQLSEHMHIQVGNNYACVCQYFDDDTFIFHPYTNDYNEIIKQIRGLNEKQ